MHMYDVCMLVNSLQLNHIIV